MRFVIERAVASRSSGDARIDLEHHRVVGARRRVIRQLQVEYVERRFGRIVTRRIALRNARHENRARRDAMDDHARYREAPRFAAERVAPRRIEERRIDDHFFTAADERGARASEVLIERVAALRRIQPFGDRRFAALQRRERGQAFALDVRPDPHGRQAFDQPLREPGFSRSRQTAHQNHRRMRFERACVREVDVRFVAPARFGVLCVLRVQRRDLRAHHRTVHEIKTEQRAARVVAGVLEIAVEKRIREIGASAHAAVHHEKSHVADQIDPAQPFAELDAVECVNAVVEPHEVRQVQIAVAFAHEAVRLARVDQR